MVIVSTYDCRQTNHVALNSSNPPIIAHHSTSLAPSL